jgi:hypothetical protein
MVLGSVTSVRPSVHAGAPTKWVLFDPFLELTLVKWRLFRVCDTCICM